MTDEDEELGVNALVNDATMLGGDGFVCMREQDAEILESIVLLDQDSMPTPILTSTRGSNAVDAKLLGGDTVVNVGDINDIPLMRLDDSTVGGISHEAFGSVGFTPIAIPEEAQLDAKISSVPPTPRRPHHRPRTSATASTLITTVYNGESFALNSKAEGDSIDVTEKQNDERLLSTDSLQPLFRRALSGEVWTSSEKINGNEGSASVCIQTETIKSQSTIETSATVADEKVNPLKNESSLTHGFMRRTESTERRMCEAAQFAEAIGEQDTLIPIIIDDNDINVYDDDDEEEDTENLQEQRMNRNIVNGLENQDHSENNVDDDGTKAFLSMMNKRVDYEERRINEAVQFVKAVGEYHLGEDISRSIRIIDDDENYAEFDEDENNHHVSHSDNNNNLDMELTNSTNKHVTLMPDMKYSHHGRSGTVQIAVMRPLEIGQSERSLFHADESLRFLNRHVLQHEFAQNKRVATMPKTRGTGFLDKLPDNYNSKPETSKQLNFVYKGIQSNPPEIVKQGMQRGNYAQLHRKAWLEVSDKYHRYGKNLRLYYRYWESLGFPTNMFFDWLDSKGEAAGQPLPEIEECPRSKLDSDTVLYITNPEITQTYRISFVPTSDNPNEATVSSADPLNSPDSFDEQKTSRLSGNHIQSSLHSLNQNNHLRKGLVLDVDNNPVVTGPDGWIFVLRDNFMYGAPKVTTAGGFPCSNFRGKQLQQRFHHSSFFGGKAVAAAGIFITDENGILIRLYPHSGHYRPGEAHMQRVLFHLYHKGIDLRTFEMDIQQILHINRDGEDKAKSKSKRQHPIDNLEKQSTGPDTAIVPSDVISNKLANISPSNDEKDKKKRKTESLHLMPAILVACFLAHKARFIGEGIFSQIHKIRKHGAEITNVTEALNIIDEGGCFWSAAQPMSSNNK